MNRFDDIFKELRKTLREQEFIFDRLFRPALETDTEEAPLHYSFSIHVDQDGEPAITEFGNTNPNREEQVDGAVQTPYTETHIDKDAGILIIVAELPGVSRENIKVKANRRKVTISAESEKKKYYKEVDTERETDPKSTSAQYKNGILEVRVKFKEPLESEEFEVEVK
ncbi:MAG: Hsp20/alpha crystallin family protein [Candidatus Freyarchaeota archaeon]|nr:Hsp20/alpha crystallin family protein [Candidatus Jordarchaeia archaeon]MBS7280594.1 Hsp20/alpha crystallin family protein [Candidatus Jordarchaeia archaeon]